MRKVIYEIVFILYSYYNKGATKNIAFDTSLITFLFVVVLNIHALLIVFGLYDLIPKVTKENKLIHYLIYIVAGLVLVELIKRFIKKKEVVRVVISKRKSVFYKIAIVIYIITSFVLALFSVELIDILDF